MNVTAVVHAFPSPIKARSRRARVWLLLSNRLGDNNQLFALARALGLPFEAKELTFNWLRKIPLLQGSGLATVARSSRRLIKPPWPDLLISAGYAAVPVARFIRRVSGGITKIVHIGNARTDISDFDLHVTTPQYPGAPTERVLKLPLPIGNPAGAAELTQEEQQWLVTYPRPRRLVAVGGPARHWDLDHGELSRTIRTLRKRKPHGSIIVATSPRTSAATRAFLHRKVTGTNEAMVGQFPRFAALLSEADEIYVTADSVSMISEAILTGKPVGIIPIRRSARGKLTHWLWGKPFGGTTLPNLPDFWDLLQRSRMAGTVELPVASQVCDTIGRTADAVCSLLAPGDAVDDGKPERAGTDLGTARCSRGR